MESGGGGNASHRRGDHEGEEKALLESGTYHHYQHPFEQSRGNSNRQNHVSNSSNIIIRKAIQYLIAVALAGFLLYHSSYSIECYFPISYHPSSGISQNSTSQSNESSSSSDQGTFSALTGNFLGGNLSFVSNNSSTTPVQQNLPYSTSPPPGAQGKLSSNTSSPASARQNLPSSHVSKETEEAKLEKILNTAAMENKTVIVTTVNAAWTEPNSLFDLFLESFRIGNGTQKFLNHLVVIALDQKSYNRCSELHPYCYALRTDGIDFSAHEAYFMHPDYVKLVWRKIEFMYTVLQLGYSAVFTDTDIMWFRDPFLHFLKDADIQTASDHYGGTPTDGVSSTGFYYVKSNNRTIQFYDLWLTSRQKFKRKHDQDVFNMVRVDPSMEEIGIKIRVLDTAFYGGFCEPSKDLNLVCIMHANCCLGLGAKLRDLRSVLEDWKNYMELPGDEREKTSHTWIRRRKCHG